MGRVPIRLKTALGVEVGAKNSAQKGEAISRHLALFRRIRGHEPSEPSEKSTIWRNLATPFCSIRVLVTFPTPHRPAGGPRCRIAEARALPGLFYMRTTSILPCLPCKSVDADRRETACRRQERSVNPWFSYLSWLRLCRAVLSVVPLCGRRASFLCFMPFMVRLTRRR